MNGSTETTDVKDDKEPARRRPGPRPTKNINFPPLKFKGVTITVEDYRDTIVPHFSKSPRDWKNNEEFQRLYEKAGLNPYEAGQLFDPPKSHWTIMAYLKSADVKSSAVVPDKVLEAFKKALKSS